MSKTNGKPDWRCGDSGGTNHRGEPCGQKVREQGDRCPYHGEEAEEIKDDIKEAFLVAAADPFRTLWEAANIAGRDYTTILRWRQDDPEFDRAVKKILGEVDKHRVRAAEDQLYRRIMSGQATSSEVLFYLSNQSPSYRENGKPGGPALTPEDRLAEQLSAREKLRQSLEGMRTRLVRSNGNGDGPKMDDEDEQEALPS